MDEIIVKASIDMEACYEAKKCRFRFQRRKNGEIRKTGSTGGEMKELYPDQNEVYKFLGYEQANKIDAKHVLERVKKEIR